MEMLRSVCSMSFVCVCVCKKAWQKSFLLLISSHLIKSKNTCLLLCLRWIQHTHTDTCKHNLISSLIKRLHDAFFSLASSAHMRVSHQMSDTRAQFDYTESGIGGFF